jgi:intracellular sulfur oxidation DsrE/DsrF family protein
MNDGLEWLLLVPDVALGLGAVVSFSAALSQLNARDRDDWWGMSKLAISMIQFMLCTLSLVVLNMVS